MNRWPVVKRVMHLNISACMEPTMMRTRISSFSVLLAVGLLTACGQSSGDSMPNQPAEAVVDASENATSSTASESLESSQTATTDPDLPSDYPADVAVYPGMDILTVNQTPFGSIVQAQADATPNAIAEHLRKQMSENGWLDTSPAPTAGEPATGLRFIKDGRTASIYLIPDGTKTDIQIMLVATG